MKTFIHFIILSAFLFISCSGSTSSKDQKKKVDQLLLTLLILNIFLNPTCTDNQLSNKRFVKSNIWSR